MSLRNVRNRTLGLAILLAVLGIGADEMVVKRELAELRAVALQREQLSTETASLRARDEQIRTYAEALGAPDLRTAFASLAASDPLSFLDGAVRKAGLVRLELANRQTGTTGRLRKNDFFLRVNGTYSELSHFVRDMEQGRRLVVIDGFVITPILSSEDVEAAISLSVYDPVGGQ